jgi:uncharacterized membrane protein (TIGR02234 family)
VGEGTGPRRAGTREVVVGLLVASALIWAGSRFTWVSATTVDDLRGTRTTGLKGSTWAAELVPLALVALAAVAAVLAVRGWVLRVVAALVVLVGVASVVPAVRLLAGSASPDRARALLDSASAQVSTSTSAPGALLVGLGGLLMVLSGGLLLRAPGRARGLSDRYQTPAVRRERATAVAEGGVDEGEADGELTERRIWDALDAGEDPTAGPGPGAGRDPHHSPSTLPGDPSTGGREGGGTQ